MALRDTIMRWLSGADKGGSKKKAANPAIYVPAYQSGQPHYHDWNTAAAIREGFKAHVIVYACVRKLATAGASVPWLLMRQRPSGDVWVPDHPAQKTLDRPNPMISRNQLFETTIGYLGLSGNAYWYVPKVGDRAEIWPLRPDRVRVVPDETKYVSAYEYTVNGKKFLIPAENVVHFKLFNPGDDYYGMSPLQAAARIVDADNAMIDWQKRSIENGARPSGALTTDTWLEDHQYAQLREHIQNAVQGSENARKVLLLYGGLRWESFSFTPEEMDWLESRYRNAVDICVAYGIDPIVLGLPIQSTYNNKSEARRAMWEDAIIPMLEAIGDTINTRFLPMFENTQDLYFTFDLSHTPAVQGYIEDKINQVEKLWSMGVPYNQAIREVDLPFDPVPGSGDISYVPSAMVPVDFGNFDIDSSVKANKIKALNLETEQERADYWKAFERRREGWYLAAERKIRERFRDEENAVLAAVERGNLDIDTVVNSQRQAWSDLLLGIWAAVVEDFGTVTAGQLGGQVVGKAIGAMETKWTFDPWTTAVRAYVMSVVADKVTGILDFTRQQLRAEIAQAIDNGESVDSISKRISAVYAQFGRSRAWTIARTEVIAASNYGSREAAKQSGIVTAKKWVTSRDGRVRDAHASIDGETVPLDQPYSNGLMYPGDISGPASQVVNCRCVESYVTK